MPVPIPTSETPEQNTTGVEIRSPNRPMTRQAIKDIKTHCTVKKKLDPIKGMRMDGVLVDKHPPDDLLEKHELYVVRDPDITYEVANDKTVSIYTNPEQVADSNGEITTMTVQEAIKHAEESDRFTLKQGDPTKVTSQQ